MHTTAEIQNNQIHEIDELVIFSWAQEHKARFGAYPHPASGQVVLSDGSFAGTTWSQINATLYNGFNDLPPNLTLRTFIESFHRIYSPLTEDQILTWVAVHKKKYNENPALTSGSIEVKEADGDSWANINSALLFGLRGLPGHRTLDEFISEHESSKNIISEEDILTWADDFRIKYGFFPSAKSEGEVNITKLGKKQWKDVDRFLMNGMHGLPKRRPRDNLYDFLSRHRKIDQLRPDLAHLTIKRITSYALEHFKAYGELPNPLSGKVVGTHSETWQNIEITLRNGGRGLPGGSSLKDLLDEYMPDTASYGQSKELNVQANTPDVTPTQKIEENETVKISVRSKKPMKPTLALERVLGWFDKHKATEGYYPIPSKEKIPGGYGRTWADLESELISGAAGPDAQLSLEAFARKFRPRNRMLINNAASNDADAVAATSVLVESGTSQTPASAPLEITVMPTAESIALSRPSLGNGTHRMQHVRLGMITLSNTLSWIDAYHEKHHLYPKASSGTIDEAPAITWQSVALALEQGLNDLPKSDSLSKFIYDQYGVIGTKLVGVPKHHRLVASS